MNEQIGAEVTVTVERLGNLEADLKRILTNDWQPGAARMIFVHATVAWAGKYDGWTEWMQHMVKTTENSETWLWRVFNAGKTVLKYGPEFYPAIPKPDIKRVSSIETYLKNFDRARVATIYEATRLANKIGDTTVIRQALAGEISQTEIKTMIGEVEAKDGGTKPTRQKRAGASAAESGDGEAAAPEPTQNYGYVTMKLLRDACAQHDIDPTTALMLLRTLKIPIRRDEE